jgi:23S rRNA (uracil1939-C5)-methyltransferase
MNDRTTDVHATDIGARGDGLAESPSGRLYIPYAAPGDHLRVRVGAPRGDGRTARIEAILEPAPTRQKPVCRHFGTCGGCALQHIQDNAVADMKRELLQRALARKGVGDAPIGPTVSVSPETRRRVRLTYRRGRHTVLGFNRRASRQVLDIVECPVVRPKIGAILEPLRALCTAVNALGSAGDLQITETETGLDLLLIPARAAEPDLAARESLAAFAGEQDLCRIAWQTGPDWEPIAERRPAIVSFAGVPVAIPPTAFLQPSRDGEDAIVGIVTRALEAEAPSLIADLYAGCGALSFPAAAVAPVHAIEGDAEMTTALFKAAAGTDVAVSMRDLQRDPMPAVDLSQYGTVIFDPPRAGARPIAEALAGSDVPHVIAVSCNPATLARDLRILVDGGYRIEQVTPIDQFKWSAHVEAVAVLHR